MKSFKLFGFFLLVIFAQSCSKEDNVTDVESITPETENNPPKAFNLISIDNNATDVELVLELDWETSTDEDGDKVLYEVYLDTIVNPISKIASNLANSSLELSERLRQNTKYYWKVIAKDDKGAKIESSSTFAFTTRYFNTGVQVTEGAAFSGRIDHASVVFDDKMWVIGGFDGSSYRNDVWYSSDGILWEQATENAAFSPRKEHASAVFDNKIWVIGGASEGNPAKLNDIWYSDNGINWTLATANTDFEAVSGHSSLVFGNKLWVFGGSTENTFFNNVWSSTDGITWTKVTENDMFPIREWNSSIVFDNKIWVIGGSNSSGYVNDIWYSSDGITWIQANANANFSARAEHTSAVFDNKIWVLGGIYASCCSDVWYSENGIDWTRAIENSVFSDRQLHSSVVFDNKIWSIGGNNSEPGFLNDIWYLD